MWPAPLRPLIKQYGRQKVEAGSLEALGYPALLVHTHVEVSKINSFFRRRCHVR